MKLLAVVLAGTVLLLLCSAVATLVIARVIETRYPPAGRFVEVAGGRLHVVEMAPQGREPEATVLLLHGASGSSGDPMTALGSALRGASGSSPSTGRAAAGATASAAPGRPRRRRRRASSARRSGKSASSAPSWSAISWAGALAYGAIRAPTAIVSGEADTIVWTNLHLRSLEREIPGARLVVLPGAGRMPHHAAPDIVAREIDAVAAKP